MKIKEILSSLFGITEGSNIIVSSDAYMTAKYGHAKTTGDLLKEFVDKMDDHIKYNSMSGKSYAAKDVNIEIVPYIDQLRDVYTRRGFHVAFLGSKDLNKIAKGGFDNANILLVSWAKPTDIVITNSAAATILGLDSHEIAEHMPELICECEG